MTDSSEKAEWSHMNKKSNYENQNMPYERFKRFGPEALTESELLAIILRTGTKGKPAIKIAEEILCMADERRDGLLGLHELTLEDLMSVNGMGEVKAVKIKCLTELAARISEASARAGMIVQHPSTVAQYFMEKMRHNKTESVMIACLDSKGKFIGEKELSVGSVNSALISPREVFMEAMKKEAVNIILVHNHPSGDPTPSQADLELTKIVSEIGCMMGIPLLDHIIIGDNIYTSFKEKGLL